MSEIVLSRVLSRVLASPAKGSRWVKGSGHGLQDKSADCGRAQLVGRIEVLDRFVISAAVARRQFASEFNLESACRLKREEPRRGRARR
jgi:hypothetical protein